MGRPKRYGCASCKRLRIKCDLARPKCEYCVATNKVCEYPERPADVRATSLSSSSSDSSIRTLSYETCCVGSDEAINDIPHLLDTVNEESLDDLECCNEPNNALLLKLNSASVQLGMSQFEYRLIHYFGFWGFERFRTTKDKSQIMAWNHFMPDLLVTSELVKTSIFAYTGIMLLREHGPEQLEHKFSQLKFVKDDCDDCGSLSKLYEFSIASFDKQVGRINSMMPRLRDGILNQREAVEMVVSSRFMLKYIGSHPQKIMPLIDLNRRSQDFLSLMRGVVETEQLCVPLVAGTMYRGFFFDDNIMDYTIPTLPLYQMFLDELDDPLIGVDPEAVPCLKNAITTFNNQTFRVAKYNNDIPFFQIISFLEAGFHQLMYNQNLMALRLLNLFAAFSLLTDCYFDRDVNIWVDFMQWYYEYNQMMFGDWYYPWDASLYRLVVVRKHKVDGFSAYANFDPVVLEMLA
ncbi:hypothetical protein DICA1_A01618 [Diutina catenulata]